mmetsp:Transcript_60983/g.142756  ORF Transcript_60983/g.142756 Transcript_60983/m.142756 type:complete len:1105 (-) Transcript_60983:15-3329(-)
MASEQEEETEILEEIDEEPTEDAEAEVDEGQDAEGSADESDAEHEETVAQDEVLDKYSVVYDQSLDKVRFPADIVSEIKRTWQLFCSNAGSPEAAGELIFNAWWAAAPSLHSYFKTPRTVLYLRIVQGIQPIVMSLSHPTELKTQIDIISFRHLDRPVTAQAVEIVRDSMLDMWEAELASEFTPKARAGWFALLNYWGGAFVFYQREYAAHIRIIHRSWREANKAAAQPEDEAELPAVAAVASEQPKAEDDEEATEENQVAEAQKQEEAGKASNEVAKTAHDSQMKVPNSFREMFLFNAAVMGYGSSKWMEMVLDQFDAMVLNVANSTRLQEECDVLLLVMSKYTDQILLPDFRAVMLATLRSLAPKDWDTEHEVAWNWLWENIERILKGQLGRPRILERALTHLIASLTEEQATTFRKELYKRFFANAPSGQDFFKQSTTRLYFLADRVVEMTVEMYREPRKMVQEISGLGLRHVGWGIPPELFSPYCSGAVDTIRALTPDENAQSAFRFSLSLIAKILVRAVTEGSTLVMRAINTNQEAALKKAIAIAPRGRRAMELLNISVGTQSISPLFWSIESGSLNSARAMLVDLLTIRADRDVYYYGCDAMFTRHPDLILRLCSDASTLLWTLFDGLVWRSRLVQNGQRRVNYYIKHLVQDVEGNFSPALKWLAHHKDPRLVCHGVVVTFADLLWNRLASFQFLLGRGYFLFTLIIFITSQSLLIPGEESLGKNIATFVCRCFLYLGSMSKLVFDHCKTFCGALKAGDYHWYWILPVPTYLHSTQQVGSLLLVLLLILMYVQEPVLWCIAFGDNGPTSIPLSSTCEEANDVRTSYAVCSCLAMMMYWALLMDFTLLSMRISAFVLVCGNVLADVGLFSLALLFLILAFATSISSLNHRLAEFDGVGPWLTGLLQMTLGMFPPSKYGDFRSEVAVLVAVSVFVAVISIFLVNLLVAQLNQSYRDIFEDMQGFARLNRASVTSDIIDQMSRKKWNKFLSHLRFEDPLEFNEGDVGMAGGIQVLEPANANMVTEDIIKRYGGPTAPSTPWPQEPDEQNDESKFARLEKLIIRATKKPKDKGAKGKKTPSALDASDLGSDQASDFARSVSQ